MLFPVYTLGGRGIQQIGQSYCTQTMHSSAIMLHNSQKPQDSCLKDFDEKFCIMTA